MTDVRSRFRGALLGLAAGDALGTSLEFTAPGPHGLTDMIGGGPFHLQPGQWTDDTSMALCLAESLVECRGFDARDQMERYLRWWRDGYLSSTGECFDIGVATSTSIGRFEHDGNPYAGSLDPLRAGNGSIMRLAPVPMFYYRDGAEAVRQAGESSRRQWSPAACLPLRCTICCGSGTGCPGSPTLASNWPTSVTTPTSTACEAHYQAH